MAKNNKRKLGRTNILKKKEKYSTEFLARSDFLYGVPHVRDVAVFKQQEH